MGTQAERVLINFSHTHCGPTLPGFMWQDDEQRTLQAVDVGTVLAEVAAALAPQAAAKALALLLEGLGRLA